MKILKLLYNIPIIPYLIIINIWTVIVSIKNININEIREESTDFNTDVNKFANKYADKGIENFHNTLPYILKLVPTIIILYFYFR